MRKPSNEFVILPCVKYLRCKRYRRRRHLGKGLPEVTPVESVGYELVETGSPHFLSGG